MLRVALPICLLVVGCTSVAGDVLLNAKNQARDQRELNQARALRRLELEKAAAAEALSRAGCFYEDTALVRESEGRYRVDEGCPALTAIVVRCAGNSPEGPTRCDGYGIKATEAVQ